MACDDRYIYYSTFVTHYKQTVSQSGVLDWVTINLPTNQPDLPTVRNRNVLHLYTQDPVNSDRILVNVTNGEFYYDSTSFVTVDISELTTDQNYYLCDSYSFYTANPLTPNSFAVTELAYDRQWSVQSAYILPNTDGGNKYGYLNIWWSEDPEFCPRGLLNDQYALIPATTDNGIDQVNQTFTFLQPELKEVASMTADLAYFVTLEDINLDDFDRNQCEEGYNYIILQDVPYGDVIIQSADESFIYSETIRRRNNRGYRVSNEINLNMQGATLKEISVCLTTLVSIERYDLVFSILTELIHIWGEELGNLVEQNGNYFISLDGKGTLPDYIDKTQEIDSSSSRFIRQTAWLCFSLVNLIKKFKTLKAGSVLELPKNIHLFLIHHLYFLTQWVDSGTGWVVDAVNEYGISTDIKDIETLIITNLALTGSLSIIYDPFIHERAAITYNKVLSIDPSINVLEPLGLSESEYVNEASRSITARLLFAQIYNRSLEIPLLASSYVELVSDSGIIPTNVLEFIYITSQLSDEQLNWTDLDRQTWQLDKHVNQIQPGLYRRTSNPQVNFDLLTSSWSILTENKFSLITGENFDLKAEESKLLVSGFYHLFKYLWPFGYRWNKLEVEFAKQGVVGSLLFACASIFSNWSLQFCILRDSQRIDSGLRAWAVDLVAGSIGLKRGFLEPDENLRRLLPDRMEALPPTLESIKSRLQNIYGTVDKEGEYNISIQEPVFPDLVEYDSVTKSFSTRSWTGSDEDFDLVLNHGNYPAFNKPGFISLPYNPNDGNYYPIHLLDSVEDSVSGLTINFTPWHEIAPKLKITTFNFHPRLNQELKIMTPYGVGLTTTLILPLDSRERWDTCITVANQTIRDLEGCGIALDDLEQSLSLESGQVMTLDDSYCIIEDPCTVFLALDDGSFLRVDNGEYLNINDDCYTPPAPPACGLFGDVLITEDPVPFIAGRPGTPPPTPCGTYGDILITDSIPQIINFN